MSPGNKDHVDMETERKGFVFTIAKKDQCLCYGRVTTGTYPFSDGIRLVRGCVLLSWGPSLPLNIKLH